MSQCSKVAKSMRVYTKFGCPPIEKLNNETVDIWSGHSWVPVEISPGGYDKLYRVKLNDGSCLLCARDQMWPVYVDGILSPTKTEDLEVDSIILPFDIPDSISGADQTKAYELGKKFAEKGKNSIYKRIFNFSRDSLLWFVAGWADYNNGIIYGDWELIHGLQMALRRCGIYETLIDYDGNSHFLVFSEREVDQIPNPDNKIRSIYTSEKTFPHVEEITIEGRGSLYTLQPLSPSHFMVIDGVLSMC